MMILVLNWVKDEESEGFIKNYKKTCISKSSITTKNWITFLLEFLQRRAYQLYERQPEPTKDFWKRLSIGLIMKFGKKKLYQTLICEFSQVKQRFREGERLH